MAYNAATVYKLDLNARNTINTKKEFLHTKPISMDLQARLVAEEHLIRNQHTRYKNRQGRILTAWEEYEAGAKTVEELLTQVVAVHGPVITGSSRSLNVVCIRNVYGGLTFAELL